MSANLEVKAALEQVQDTVRGLEAIRFRLLGVLGSLLTSAAELDRFSDVGSEVDLATEIRTVMSSAETMLTPCCSARADRTSLSGASRTMSEMRPLRSGVSSIRFGSMGGPASGMRYCGRPAGS